MVDIVHFKDNSLKMFPLSSMTYRIGSYLTVMYYKIPGKSYPWEFPSIELVCKGKKVADWELLQKDITPDVQ